MPESDMVVIDDNNYQQWLNPIVGGERRLSGYKGMFKTKKARRKGKTFEDLTSVPLIPESEWDDRIRQKEKDRSRLKDFALDMGLTVLDQNGTNYCWINAPTFCCMVTRLQETGQAIRLSPASVGAPIKNFRNQGGWGSQGLDYMRKNGINLQGDWPANAINRSYYTEENRQKAKANIVLEYYYLKNWQEMASCILAGIPVGAGYNWWSHEVTGMDILKGSHDLIIADSWSTSYGDRGYGVLKGSRKYPDDAVAITAMMPL